ncbi:MAG: hypothetical protein ACM3VS_17825 [Candidatus Dadabacteria bacterium]
MGRKSHKPNATIEKDKAGLSYTKLKTHIQEKREERKKKAMEGPIIAIAIVVFIILIIYLL